MPEVEETIIDLRLTKRFGCNRIRFRLRRIIGLSLSTRTIYKILKRHGLNILKCNAKIRTYKRFAMQHPNDMVPMDILGPFYLSNSNERNYFISCLDDCSRKVASKWSERKRTIDVLDVLEEWIVINGKPKKVMRDNGKQFTSKIFKGFLEHNNIKDKPIPKSYPQLQGKVEAYNKIVKNEFLAVEDISSIDDGKLRYEMFNTIQPGGSIIQQVPREFNTFAYVIGGGKEGGLFGSREKVAKRGQIVLFDKDGDKVSIRNPESALVVCRSTNQ